VVGEISRVLEPGGIALFDMGNRCSLNEWVGRAHTETAAMCNLRVSEMRRMINEAGLEIVEHHALQILPFWGNKPKWLRPLLKPFWKNLFAKRIAGKMLDQWVCALPGFKHVAFRHFFICRKK
jgi:SAM-dependent methyltransferase